MYVDITAEANTYDMSTPLLVMRLRYSKYAPAPNINMATNTKFEATATKNPSELLANMQFSRGLKGAVIKRNELPNAGWLHGPSNTDTSRYSSVKSIVYLAPVLR